MRAVGVSLLITANPVSSVTLLSRRMPASVSRSSQFEVVKWSMSLHLLDIVHLVRRWSSFFRSLSLKNPTVSDPSLRRNSASVINVTVCVHFNCLFFFSRLWMAGDDCFEDDYRRALSRDLRRMASNDSASKIFEGALTRDLGRAVEVFGWLAMTHLSQWTKGLRPGICSLLGSLCFLLLTQLRR